MPKLTPSTRPTPPRGKRSAIGAPTRTKMTHVAASENFFSISTAYRLRLRVASLSSASALRTRESASGDAYPAEGARGRGDLTAAESLRARAARIESAFAESSFVESIRATADWLLPGGA